MGLQVNTTAMALIIAGVLLAACNDSQTRTAVSTNPVSTNTSLSRTALSSPSPIDDPAMATNPATAVTTRSAQSARPSPINTPDDAMAIDPASRRVYLPTTGWLDEQQFWNVYFNEPEKLSVDIDFLALQSMGFSRPDHI